MSERRGSTTNPFHFDLLGSLRAVSNSGGTATSEATLYEAFGNVVTGETDWTGQTTGRPFGFVGGEQYQSDSESGLQLLGNRYYDPTLGRFLSSDPAEDGDNWYAYVDNNPTGFVDPDGLQMAGVIGRAGLKLGGRGLAHFVPGLGWVLVGVDIYLGAKFIYDYVHTAHTKNARPSTKGVHEEGEARTAEDQGGEKADVNRTEHKTNGAGSKRNPGSKRSKPPAPAMKNKGPKPK